MDQDNLFIHIALYAPDRKYKDSNAGYRKMLGKEPGERLDDDFGKFAIDLHETVMRGERCKNVYVNIFGYHELSVGRHTDGTAWIWREIDEEEYVMGNAMSIDILGKWTDIILAIDTEFKYMYYNDAHVKEMEKLVGDRAKDICIGANMLEILNGSGQVQMIHNNWDPVFSGAIPYFHQVFEFPDERGGTVHYQMRIDPILTDGSITGGLCVATNITKSQLVLRKALDEAESASRSKTAFLSNMSHELRTPLNAILGFSQLLISSTAVNPQQHGKFIKIIHKSGQYLLELVNDILDLSRIENERLTVSLEDIELNTLIDDAIILQKLNAQARNITIKKKHCTGKYIYADVQRTIQVLANILSNAIKYNKEGGSVQFSCKKSHEYVVIKVKDTGIGISKKNLTKIGQPFERLGVENVDGCGIGLALTKKLLSLMDGKLKIRSKLGVGTVVSIYLKCGEETNVPVPASPEEWVQNAILLIDDNLSNVELMKAIVENRGDKLLSTTQGRLGFDIACNVHPKLILLDINLPDANGVDILKKLKSNDITKQIPVVCISASSSHGIQDRVKKLGAIDYLVKPVNVQRLGEIMNSVL